MPGRMTFSDYFLDGGNNFSVNNLIPKDGSLGIP